MILHLKQVGMAAGTDKMQFVANHSVQEQPVRFDMNVPVPLPVPLERMIEGGRRSWPAFDQQRQQSTQLGQVFAALFCSFHVAFELR